MTDVVVAGLGPAGLVAAHVLAAAGLDVVALEAGGAELSPGRHPVAAAAPTVRRSASERALVAPAPAPGANAIGGAKLLAAGQAFRLPERSDLERDYAAVEALLRVAPSAASPWLERMENAARDCGWAPFPAPLAGRRLGVPERVRVLTGACVVDLLDDGVRWRGDDGTLHEQRARAVVLACGVLENARLLLLLAGVDGPVGSGFATHAFVHVRGRFAGPLGRDVGRPGQAIAVPDFEVDGSLLQASMVPGAGGDPCVGAVWAQPRQRAWAGSYLDLDPDHRDPFGRPLLRITHALEDDDRAPLLAAMARWLEAAGATETWVEGDRDDPAPLSTHLTGGAPVGSVLGADLRVPDRELVVLGASSFPDSGTRGPTLTIEATAWRAAHALVERLA